MAKQKQAIQKDKKEPKDYTARLHVEPIERPAWTKDDMDSGKNVYYDYLRQFSDKDTTNDVIWGSLNRSQQDTWIGIAIKQREANAKAA